MLIEPREIQLKGGEKITLRSPRATDAENLLAHLKASFRESHRNMNTPPDYWENFPVEKEREILSAFETSPSKFMISAFDREGAIVANLGCFGNETSPYLKHNARIGMDAVVAYQNRGLGTALLKTAIQEAKKSGLHRLELTVRTFNTAGITLYEKTGFKRTGHLKHVAFIEGEYLDEYSYELLL